MPADRSSQFSNGRPLMPTLASNRAAKAPFTPKLATKANAKSTPGPRLAASGQSNTPTRVGSTEEHATPVNALLNNVTPRSSSRKSRVDSSQSTPNGISVDTPTGGQGKSPTLGRSDGFDGLGISESPKSIASRPMSQISGLRHSPAASTISLQNSRGSSRPFSEVVDRDNSANFFHVSDAKTQCIGPRQPELKKTPTFFYADGREEFQTKTIDVPSPAISAEDKPKLLSKFFHADGSIDQAQGTPLLSPPISTTSSRSSFISSPIHAVPSLLPNSQLDPPQARSASPSNDNIHLSYRKGVSQIIPPNTSRQAASSISATSTPVLSNQSHFDVNETPRRRSSVASSTVSRSRAHAKTASLSSIDATPRKSSGLQNSSPIPPPFANLPNTSSRSELVSGMQQSPKAFSPTSSTWPRSPTKSATGVLQDGIDNSGTSNPTLQHLNELATKARHDRKVMDLEISNSSLLTVNRSLEREIRKQKAELRRFRRLTRKSSIRNFSLASTERTASYGSTAEDSGISGIECGVEGLDLEEDYENDDFDSEDYSDDSDDENGEKKGEKDAKRLRLDLSKHREILVDSQKLNQSIRRCVGFTEELISQGKKALEYRVRVSDVKLGGRVLSEDEDERDVDGIRSSLGEDMRLKDQSDDADNTGLYKQNEGMRTNQLIVRPSKESERRTVSFESVISSEFSATELDSSGVGD